MSKITISAAGKLQVPQQVEIPFIEGDGVGPEITAVTQKVVDAAVTKAYGGKRRILWKEVLAGGKSFEQTGSWLPDETMQAFRDYKVGIKGPLTTPVGGGIRSLNVALRQELDLYVCLRPVRWFRGVVSPVKEPQQVDMHIFRENTEDIYAGIEWQAGTPEAEKFLKFLTDEMGVKKVRFPQSSSFGVKPVSCEGSQRLVRSALEYAATRKLPSVTLVHKGNIMKFTEGGFKNWGYDVAEAEFAEQTFTTRQYDAIKKEQGAEAADRAMEAAKTAGKVIVKDVIADAFLQNTLLIPEPARGNGGRHRHRPRREYQLPHGPRDLRSDARHRTEHCGQGYGQSLFAVAFGGDDARIPRLEGSGTAHHRRNGKFVRSGTRHRRPRALHARRYGALHVGIRRRVARQAVTAKHPSSRRCTIARQKSDGQESNIKAVHGGTKKPVTR